MTIVVPGGAAGAASGATLESLAASVAKWLNRTDLDLVLVDFVRLAEAEFARDPRIRSSFQTVVVDGYTTDGEIALPADMLELQELRVGGSVLTQLPHADWRDRVSGPYFTRIGNVSHLTGKPASEYRLTYMQKLPQLAFPSDSNWLLREHYDVYLWKCCEQGSVWMRDVEATQGYNQKYEMAVNSLLTANNYHAWGGAPVQVQSGGVV
jgi:hypothetical protein